MKAIAQRRETAAPDVLLDRILCHDVRDADAIPHIATTIAMPHRRFNACAVNPMAGGPIRNPR